MSVAEQMRAALAAAPDPPPPAMPLPPGPASAERTMVAIAVDGVAVLVHWLVILILLSQAITSVLDPPEGVRAIGVLSGLVCLLWATFALGMGVLRGTRPDGGDAPPPVWLALVASVGCLASLVIVRVGSELPGPWSSEVVAGGLVVASLTVWAGPVAGGASGIVLALGVLAASVAGQDASAPLNPSLAEAVPGVALMAAGFALALGLGALRWSAMGLEESLDERDELLVREESVRAGAEAAAEVERSLHDSALNTLETIAAHGDHLDRQLVADRCRADNEQLSSWRWESGLADLDEVRDRLGAHAARLGLHLEVDTVADPDDPGDVAPGAASTAATAVDIPPPVLGALAGAATEALTNVAKHSGRSRAGLLVSHGRTGVQVLVADGGVGPGPASEGFGLARSVQERMTAVGGTSMVTEGPGRRGTVVLLGWRPQAQVAGGLGADLLARTAGVAVAAGTLIAGVASALVVLGWSTYEVPVLGLVAAVAPVLVAAAMLERSRDGLRIGGRQVAVVCATYVLVGAICVAADPRCASVLGEGAMLDSRAPMIAVALLLAPRVGVLASLVATVSLAHLATALVWHARWSGCGADTASSGIYAVAFLVAAWLFVRRIERVSAEAARTRAQATAAQVRIVSRLSVRAEEEHWVADTLASAALLLNDLAEGTRDPASPDTRAACAAEAAFLRGLLAVGRAPASVRGSARTWMRLLHAAGVRVQVRAGFADCDPPAWVVTEVGASLATVASNAPGCSVTLSAWSDPDAAALLVTAQGGAVARVPELPAYLIGVGPSARLDATPDTVTLEWLWPRAVPASDRNVDQVRGRM